MPVTARGTHRQRLRLRNRKQTLRRAGWVASDRRLSCCRAACHLGGPAQIPATAAGPPRATVSLLVRPASASAAHEFRQSGLVAQTSAPLAARCLL